MCAQGLVMVPLKTDQTISANDDVEQFVPQYAAA